MIFCIEYFICLTLILLLYFFIISDENTIIQNNINKIEEGFKNGPRINDVGNIQDQYIGEDIIETDDELMLLIEDSIENNI